MKRILSLFVVLLFVAGCGGGSGGEDSNVQPNPDPVDNEEFEPIPVFTEIPEEIIELFKNALTDQASRKELVDKTRGSFLYCQVDIDGRSRLSRDEYSDEELWDDMVWWWDLDDLESWGNNPDEAIRNTLSDGLDLTIDDEFEMERYGDSLEIDEVWEILADELC